MKITIMDRNGVTGKFKPYTYKVTKKLCENWGISYENKTSEDIEAALIEKCEAFGITLIAISK